MICKHEFIVEYFEHYDGYEVCTGYEYCKKCNESLDDVYADEIEEIMTTPKYFFNPYNGGK